MDEVVQKAGSVKRIIEIAMTWRVPCFEVACSVAISSHWQQSLFVDSRVAALIESCDLNL